MHIQSTITIRPSEPHSIPVHATMSHTCDACGLEIRRGEWFFHFDTSKVACMACAMGPELLAPSLTLQEVA